MGKLANNLSKKTQGIVIAAPKQCHLFSSVGLKNQENFNIEVIDKIFITDKSYRPQLKQIINQIISQYFVNLKRRVNRYYHQAFLESKQVSSEIEIQPYLRWDIRIDFDNTILLNLDYGNKYTSLCTIDKIDISSLSPEQFLVHSYDAGSCRYVGVADYNVSTPQPELGNISLLEYHSQFGNIPKKILDSISKESKAILVKYGSKGKTKIYGHISHLLKKSFTKDDIEASIFNAQVLSINDRFIRATKVITKINASSGLVFGDHKINFNPNPEKPQTQINCINSEETAESYYNNLDFGNGVFCSYPAQGLNQRQLLEKPEDKLKLVVFYPHDLQVNSWCDHFKTLVESFKIQLEFDAFRGYRIGNDLDIQRQCRNLSDFHQALIFVPDKENFNSDRKLDPYPILKRKFVEIGLSSQAITKSNLQSGFNDNQGYNILLKMLGKLGYFPWKLRKMPGNTQAFMGLDIGRKYGIAVGVAAFIVSPQGKVIGWFPANFQSHRETFDLDTLRRIFFDLINLFEEANSTQLKSLVIHRDGKFQAGELRLIQQLMPQLQDAGIQCLDAVEIIKSDYSRAGKFNPKTQKWDNPRRGNIWSLPENKVAVMTTGKTEIKGSNNFVPRPIIINRCIGNNSPILLAEQVYWLSEMHIGSTQTIRLPITTYYPDKTAEYALEGLLPTGLQKGCNLPF